MLNVRHCMGARIRRKASKECGTNMRARRSVRCQMSQRKCRHRNRRSVGHRNAISLLSHKHIIRCPPHDPIATKNRWMNLSYMNVFVCATAFHWSKGTCSSVYKRHGQVQTEKSSQTGRLCSDALCQHQLFVLGERVLLMGRMNDMIQH